MDNFEIKGMEQFEIKGNNISEFTIVLSTRGFQHLGRITGIKDLNAVRNFNKANEISFSVCKYDLFRYKHNGLLRYKTHLKLMEKLWEQIVDLKLIWIKELDEYFQIKVNISDSKETIKTIVATSLCEAELSQIETGSIEINTDEDIARDDYYSVFPTVFYRDLEDISKYDNIWNDEKYKDLFSVYVTDEKGEILRDEHGNGVLDTEKTSSKRYSVLKNSSLMHRLLDKIPHYSIAYISPSLWNLERTFSIDSNIYDFFVGECSEQFDCLFQFDTTKREIYVYDLLSVCECGERGEFFDECPKCHNVDLKYYGEDTTILIDKNVLTDEISLTNNTDELKNCFKLVAGDEKTTDVIRMLNPNGSDYIYHFSDFQLEDMSEELKKKLADYNKKMLEREDDYEKLVLKLYGFADDVLYLESGMMPTIEHAEVTATTEANKLTKESLSPTALSSLSIGTHTNTVGNAIKNYAKTIVKTGYVEVDIHEVDGIEPTFKYIGTDDNGIATGKWRGRIKITNNSDAEDVVITDYLDIDITTDNEFFARQQIAKKILSEDDGTSTIFDVLNIEDIDKFKEALTYYSLTILKGFNDAVYEALNALSAMGYSHEDTELYNDLYLPYYEKLMACQNEMNKRQSEIDALNAKAEDVNKERKDIQADLDFQANLGDYYKEFCSYRREQKYTNENFISDGLDDAELIDKVKQFIDLAKKELIKASEIQYSLSSTLNNFLMIPAFQPLKKKFKLGNWLRLKVDNRLYRLRFISYSYNFDSSKTFNVEFSNVTKERGLVYEAQEVIKTAQSMGTSYSYVSKQANKGSLAKTDLEYWKENGLNSALVQINNNLNEEVSINKHGLLARKYDDITDTYDDKQLKITSNIMAFTDDNWKTCKQAIGEHQYQVYDYTKNGFVDKTGYGMTSEFVTSGIIYGTNIYGGEIYSTNFKLNQTATDENDFKNKRYNCTGSFIDLKNGHFSFDGKLTWNGTKLTIHSDAILDSLNSIDTESGINIVIDTIGIKAENIDTTTALIKPNQIEVKELEIDATQIKGDVHVKAENIDTTTTLIKPNQIAISDIELDISQVSGTIGSDRIADTLSNKTLSGSFAGTINASGITTTADGTTYTGMTTDVVLENYTLSFVNGLLVDVITN